MGKYYIQHKTGGDVVDIESTYEGLFVVDTSGLINKGKLKNVYTETFADKKGMKVSYGSTPLFEATSPSISFVIIKFASASTDIVDVYTSFIDFITGKTIFFWDDIRNVKVELAMLNAVTANDIQIRGQERIEFEVEFTNVNGDYEKTSNA